MINFRICFLRFSAFLLSVFLLCSGEVNLDPLVHFRTRHGDTLLHAAVKSRRPEALVTFLELGCLTEALDRELRTPLWLATGNGELEMMKILVKYGADLKIRYGQFNETLLHAASKNGRDLCLFWLLDAGFSTEVRDGSGWTALHSAAAFGHPTTARLLVARGGDVNTADSLGETPLHKAIRLGKPAVVEQLMELGADPAAVDVAGHSPLFWAERFRSDKWLKILKERKGGDITKVDKYRGIPEMPFNSNYTDMNHED